MSIINFDTGKEVETNKELIQMLENCLEKVKNGQVVGLALIEALSDGSCTNEWNTGINHSGSIAIGAIRLLARLGSVIP